jgi:hypothetical protein
MSIDSNERDFTLKLYGCIKNDYFISEGFCGLLLVSRTQIDKSCGDKIIYKIEISDFDCE